MPCHMSVHLDEAISSTAPLLGVCVLLSCCGCWKLLQCLEQMQRYTHVDVATCRLHGSAGALISIGLLKSVDLGFLQLCLQSLKESAGGADL